MTLHVLVLGDSLAFHGPDQPHRPSDPRLYPNRVAASLAEGAQDALRWTKHTLNHWYRQQAAAFDASLAYEFLGFAGPDAREGLASHVEKRPPRFT